MTTPSKIDQQKLLEKLPILSTKGQRVMLTKTMMKGLTDLEFSILWYIPNLDVVVSPKTKDYIEQRRRRLDLKFKGYAGFDLNNEEDENNMAT